MINPDAPLFDPEPDERDAVVTAHIERVNKIKDRVDESFDAQRTHGGQTLDEFLAGK